MTIDEGAIGARENSVREGRGTERRAGPGRAACQSEIYLKWTNFRALLVAPLGVTTEAYDVVPFVRGPLHPSEDAGERGW